MPLHLPSGSRRDFLLRLAGSLVFGTSMRAEEGRVDPDRIAILNDTHIGAQQPAESPMPANLREAVAWVLGQERLPAAVVCNGDLALNEGRAGDYTHFAKLIAPLRAAGLPGHLTLGNHDDRDVFHQVLKAEKAAEEPVVSRHVSVVPLARANLFLLDSLQGTNVMPGLLGREQLVWLGRMLDAHGDKPALVFAHHNLRLGADEKYFAGGLEDTGPLWELLVARAHVKAYIHGHIHRRDFSQHRGLHLVDTPATSFVLRAESTTGWTMVRLSEGGGEFSTHTHLKKHAWNGAVKRLAWRV